MKEVEILAKPFLASEGAALFSFVAKCFDVQSNHVF
jgi:hypothetical protein